jgi:hypothetical protein
MYVLFVTLIQSFFIKIEIYIFKRTMIKVMINHKVEYTTWIEVFKIEHEHKKLGIFFNDHHIKLLFKIFKQIIIYSKFEFHSIIP